MNGNYPLKKCLHKYRLFIFQVWTRFGVGFSKRLPNVSTPGKKKRLVEVDGVFFCFKKWSTLKFEHEEFSTPPPKQDLKLAPWGAIFVVMGLYQLHVSFFYVTPFDKFGLKSVFGFNKKHRF